MVLVVIGALVAEFGPWTDEGKLFIDTCATEPMGDMPAEPLASQLRVATSRLLGVCASSEGFGEAPSGLRLMSDTASAGWSPFVWLLSSPFGRSMELDVPGFGFIEERAHARCYMVSMDTRVLRQGVRVNPTACCRCASRPPKV